MNKFVIRFRSTLISMEKDKFLLKIRLKIKDFAAKQDCFAQPIPL